MTRSAVLLLSLSLASGAASSASAQTPDPTTAAAPSPEPATAPVDASAATSADLGVASQHEPAKAPADRIQLHMDFISGFAGELHGGSKSPSLAKSELLPALGGYGGMAVPFSRWFALEAGIAGRAWRTKVWEDAKVDRDWLFDATVRPRFRFVPADGLSEVYVTVPVGVVYPVLSDDKSAPAYTVNGTLGWTAGAALGGTYFVTEDLGIHYELAYQRHEFAYVFDPKNKNASVDPNTGLSVPPPHKVTEDLAFQQVVISIGAIVAL